MIKVLIVDDSKLIRALLAQMVSSAPDMMVVGEAEDPFEARDKIKVLNPDVITLDIEMPKMNGITFLRNLMRLRPMPVVMISTLTAEGAPITLEALSIGAVDFLEKPKANVASELPRYTESLLEKLRVASQARIYRPVTKSKESEQRATAVQQNWDNLSFKVNHLVAIGASTGGTEAIKEVVTRLPASFPAVVITQHIPPVFSTTYAERLNRISNMLVYEASDGQQIINGSVYIAPGDRHLRVVKRGSRLYCQLDDSPPVNRHRPSVDVMFESIGGIMAKQTTAVMLTGMGADGARGMLQLRQSGGYTIAQNEASCVVYGMPKAAVELGAVEKELPLDRITQALIQAAVRT